MFKSEEHKTTPRKTEGVIRRTVPSPAREAIKPSPVGEGGPLAVDEANELQQIKIEAGPLAVDEANEIQHNKIYTHPPSRLSFSKNSDFFKFLCQLFHFHPSNKQRA